MSDKVLVYLFSGTVIYECTGATSLDFTGLY